MVRNPVLRRLLLDCQWHYLAFGSIGGIGDAGDIIRHGSPLVLLWLFGVITIPLGLWLWYGLGPQFGIGGEVDRGVTHAVVAILLTSVILEVLLSPSTVG